MSEDMFAMLYILAYFAGLFVITAFIWWLGVMMRDWLYGGPIRKSRRYTLPDDRAMLKRRGRS